MIGYYDVTSKKDLSAFKKELSNQFKKNVNNLPIQVVCIGTDRATGDALGPYVGTLLKKKGLNVKVNGTLENPVHAKNLYEHFESNHYTIAIDACLGNEACINTVIVKNEPIYPGNGVGKELPAIGDLTICGIVNLSSGNPKTNMAVISNTRFYHVYLQAEFISKALSSVIKDHLKTA